jgi:DNA polymerase-3 subunit epsilon
MLLLTIDLETSGLNLNQDKIVELGMAMYNLEKKTIVRMMGTLVTPSTEIPVERWEAAEKIHNIPWSVLQSCGMPEATAFKYFLSWYNTADYIAGHNILLFDKLFLETWTESYGQKLAKKLWVDTTSDLPVRSTKLIWMLAEQCGFVNPFPHRALFDALGVLKLITHFDPQVVIERAKLPSVTVQAQVSYDERDKARERGYRWESKTRQWIRTMKICDVSKEQAEAGFPIMVLNESK